MTVQPFRTVWLSACLAILLLAVGCGPSIGPADTGGERVAGAEGMGAALGGGYFSVAPDGKRIFFPVATKSRAKYPTSYMIYDFGRRKAVLMDADERAQALLDKAAFVGLGCWSEDSKKITVPGRTGSLVADVTRSKPKWKATDPNMNPMGTMKACSQEAALAERVKIELVSSTEVRIVDAEDPDRVYAIHTATKIDGFLEVVNVNLSPSGKAMSYVLQDARGSLGGYVLSLRRGRVPREPRFLAPQVLGAIQWGQGEAYVLACIREGRGRNAIYRWKN
jgi:hypothetical protein